MPTVLLILLLAVGWILAVLTIIVFVMGAERSRRAERDYLAAAAQRKHSETSSDGAAENRLPCPEPLCQNEPAETDLSEPTPVSPRRPRTA
ncbi:hypothetical protein LVY72_23640 [Arthrobacter sp. I2-34]|uniref:Uncharacterized protein n=1 Tax=Arthrobacter hankyongi TaxID=2904801 RepID=A0ABS9LDX4_9MICC|nr:hypothetical protein [Arthrobacter hankyongi]MCG2624887.1 hypothetical protein [Arthrobacter hankyongi]